jgi:hypothetical protein
VLIERMTEGVLVIQVVDAKVLDSHITIIYNLVAKLQKFFQKTF